MAHMQDHYAHWLRDAHAMEEQAISMLSAQAKRIENYPLLEARIEQHLTETRGQEQALRTLLDKLPSGRSSALKDATGRLAAMLQGMTGALTQDEVVKGAMTSYAFEHFEIATYRVLIAAADELAETEAKAVFEQILQEETAMAAWLQDNLDDTTRLFLMRDERDLQAKR
ncbi:ferritin-like metal-binding protein YciE [Pseudorhizobium tarimense]|uniref:Ferritin-like metal-binding protein YciE n=1 Tax=Pseudorhizobium tarimense TaxID=1079109 RepID=A0ABV2H8X9_9HYPH|nr:ferritin-like domain-containing protein [Pseudorhizobium tarimense]MCJ8520115.1 ferritin-like domain-containing protein [Pseudorhizobium tarimense]